MKIKAILVQHGFGKYPEAIPHAKQIISKLQGSEMKVDLVIYDTALTQGYYSELAQHSLYACGNLSSEFTGFQAGISTDASEYEGFLFITSAFKFSHQKFISLMDQFALRSAVENSYAVGHIDAYPEKINFFEYRESAWLRTGFFFLPSKIIQSLARVDILPKRFNEIFGSAKCPFANNELISENFKEYLLGWLTGFGKKADNNSKWHSEFLINESNFLYFKEKVRSIILEKVLTARIKSLGYSVLDIEYIKSSGRIEYDDFDNQIAEIRWYRKANGLYD